MIKINYLFPTVRFSTLRLPHRHTVAFQLNHRIRSCLTLTDLAAFLQKHDQDIRTYAKTSILQYLNEFPLSFSMASIQTPLKVYFYVLTLDNLNLYEEQLRHSNLIKLLEYSGRDGVKIRHLVEDQERKLVELGQKQGFDLVDAINWLVMRKTLRGNSLVFHSLQVICQSDSDRYENLFTKLINLVLKKIDDLEWINVRKYKVIFKFMSQSYQENRQNISKQISNCYKLASLKLHLLGYDYVPLPLRTILLTVQQHAHKLDLRNLETALTLTALLPYNTYHPSTIKFLLNKVLQKAQTQMLYLQMLPLQRLSEDEVDSIAQLYVNKWFSLNKTPYYINKPHIQILVYHPIFIQHLEREFCRPISLSQRLIVTDICGYIASAIKLLNYYRFHPQKQQAFKNHFVSVYQKYAQAFGQKGIIQNNSLLNVVHLRYLQEECSMAMNKKQFYQEIESTLYWFARKKKQSNWRFKISASQIEEVIYHYKNTQSQPILQIIISILTSEIHNIQDFSYSCGAWTIFSLEGSINQAYFQTIIRKLYSKFEGQELFALAQYYILFPYKTKQLTTKILHRLWLMGKRFAPIARVISQCDLCHLEVKGLLTPQLRQIMHECVQAINEQEIKELSIGELSNLVNFLKCYHHDIAMLARKCAQVIVSHISKNMSNLVKGEREEKKRLLIKGLKSLICLTEQNQILCGHLQALKAQQFGSELLEKELYRSLGCSVVGLGQGQLKVNKDILQNMVDRCVLHLSKKEILLQLLDRQLKGKLLLDQSGRHYLQQQIQGALIKKQIYPLDIKSHYESSFFPQAAHLDLQPSQVFTRTLIFTLKEIDILESNQFYIWCLNIGQQYASQDLLHSALDCLSTRFLGSDSILKVIKILEQYPHLIHLNFLQQVTRSIAFGLPNYNQTYFPFLEYISKILESLPPQYTIIAGDLLKQIQFENQKAQRLNQMKKIQGKVSFDGERYRDNSNVSALRLRLKQVKKEILRVKQLQGEDNEAQ